MILDSVKRGFASAGVCRLLLVSRMRCVMAITGKFSKKTFRPRKIVLEKHTITGKMAKNIDFTRNYSAFLLEMSLFLRVKLGKMADLPVMLFEKTAKNVSRHTKPKAKTKTAPLAEVRQSYKQLII